LTLLSRIALVPTRSHRPRFPCESSRTFDSLEPRLSLLTLGIDSSVGWQTPVSLGAVYTGKPPWTGCSGLPRNSREPISTVAAIKSRNTRESRRTRLTWDTVDSRKSRSSKFSPISLGATRSWEPSVSLGSCGSRESFRSRKPLLSLGTRESR